MSSANTTQVLCSCPTTRLIARACERERLPPINTIQQEVASTIMEHCTHIMVIQKEKLHFGLERRREGVYYTLHNVEMPHRRELWIRKPGGNTQSELDQISTYRVVNSYAYNFLKKLKSDDANGTQTFTMKEAIDAFKHWWSKQEEEQGIINPHAESHLPDVGHGYIQALRISRQKKQA